MPRKKAVEPDDDQTELAEPVTQAQREELYERGFKGAFPSTRLQADWLLQRLRAAPTGADQSRDNAPVTQT